MVRPRGVSWERWVLGIFLIRPWPWCQQLGAKVEGDVARISFNSTKPIDAATLVSTTDVGFTGDRKWSESPAELRKNQSRVTVEATIPPGTTAWFIRLNSGGLVACSDFQESE